MEHNHSHSHHSHSHHSHDNISRNIGIVFFLNLFFSVFEILGGLYTNSIAILSDAVHDFGDSAALGISWYLQKKSNQKVDNFYSYGYKRYSLLGAVIISMILIISSVFIIKESITRLIYPEPSNAKGMLILAIIGILINGAAVLRLKTGKSFNEKAVYYHMMEDVLGWIAVLIGSILMQFYDIPVIDPLLSLGITLWVLSNVYKNIKNTFKVLLQEVPNDIDVTALKSQLLSIININSIHDFHLWSLDGEKNIMTIHIVMNKPMDSKELVVLKKQIREISNNFGIQHTTIELEEKFEEETCIYKHGCD